MSHLQTHIRRPVPIISARTYGPPKPGTFSHTLLWPMWDMRVAVEKQLTGGTFLLPRLMQNKLK